MAIEYEYAIFDSCCSCRRFGVFSPSVCHFLHVSVCVCATDSLILFSDLSSDFGRYFYGKRLKKIERKKGEFNGSACSRQDRVRHFIVRRFSCTDFYRFFIIISYFKVWFCQYSHNKNISHILFSYRYIISHARNTVRGLKS